MPGPRHPEGNPPDAPTPPAGVSRRVFFKTVGSTAAVSSITAASQAAAEMAREADDPVRGPGPIEIRLTVNGEERAITVEPATTLLTALRFHLHLTGPKEICDRGACGGCSVLLDGKLVNACLLLAIDAEGRSVTTVEGLAKDGKLDPIQESFIRHDGLQCGYCTPGLVMASRALLNGNPKPDLPAIKRGLCGNICRCGTYTNIFNAVLEASGQEPLVDTAAAPGKE